MLSQKITTREESVELLQITDTHLYESADGSLLSVNTHQSLNAVIEQILTNGEGYDAIVATGDISQDHTQASYRRFEQLIAPLSQPCFWLPGNHDNQMSMGMIGSSQIIDTHHILLGEHWQAILLNSQVEGVPYGHLSSEQLMMAEQLLTNNPQRHTLILLHHHPVLIGSQWLDQHTLENAYQLWEVIKNHSNVQALLCGHVHQNYDRIHHGVRVMTTPSTCVQFKPNSQQFALDQQAPGWRKLSLHADGTISTVVDRLNCDSFKPDFEAQGY